MNRAEMREKHGSPAEFLVALWAAHAQNFATVDEVERAYHAYCAEWDAAE